MNNSQYTGIAIIGNENMAGIYTVNNGIVDMNGTGIYHLFYKNYEHDLIHTACTMIKVNGVLYYGNKKWNGVSHPVHLQPYKTYVENSFIFTDEFEIPEINVEKKQQVLAFGKNTISFKTTINNKNNEDIELEVYGLAIIRNGKEIKTNICDENSVFAKTGDQYVGLKSDGAELIYVVEDSPTDFTYKTLIKVLNSEECRKDISTKCKVGIAVGKKVIVPANSKIEFQWSLLCSDKEEEIKNDLVNHQIQNSLTYAKNYWNGWLEEGFKKYNPKFKINDDRISKIKEDLKEKAITNLISLKAACIEGNVPADLTGHYFSDKMPCYYARDSIMVARALFISGHYKEFEDIMMYLVNRKRKDNGEFHQRYNGKGEPSEGANNNVFHQIDSIGYFCKMIRDYYFETGKMLVSFEYIKELIEVIESNKSKNGMIGPEGGVNEGVFGPGYITSSNMFVYGGIVSAIDIAKELKKFEIADKWNELADRIYKGIQSTFDVEYKRYNYGYVEYSDEVIRKYDTPQYFGVLYGYPNDEGMKKTHEHLVKNASFFDDGIGYSEQEYHHGPWMFNTGACAEYCAVSGDVNNYINKTMWMFGHSNEYGLMPEAIDANDEKNCFINPLTWACAEFVAAYFITD